MTATITDLLAIKRGTDHFQVSAGAVADLAEATVVVDDLTSTDSAAALSANAGRQLAEQLSALGTSEHMAADIAARDALPELVVGDKVEVDDASADPTVASGWAIYRVNGIAPLSFRKIAEQESLDVVQAPTNLNATPSPTGVDISSSTGSSATIPVATNTNAGLVEPATLATVASLNAASHAAVTIGSGNTPLSITAGQALTFDIGALPVAP